MGIPSKERRQYWPQLPITERDRRWSAARKQMSERGLDALIFYAVESPLGWGLANYRYMTHIGGHHGGCFLFPLAGEPVLFALPPHENIPFNPYITAQDWVTDIRPNRGMAGVAALVQEWGLGKGRIGVVGYKTQLTPPNLPYYGFLELKERLSDARITDETGIFEELRLIKSPIEVEMIARAGQIARVSLDAMLAATLAGARECDVYAAWMSAQIKAGAEPQIFNMLTSGSIDDEVRGIDNYLLHGIAPPLTPTARPLQNGDLVVCEYHTSYGGYMAAAEFSWFVGQAPSELKAIHRTCAACLEAGLPYFKPGVTLGELLAAIRRPVEEAGMDFLELGFHGHGLASPEFPTIVYKSGQGSLAPDGLDSVVLQENMVFGNNIDVFDPRWRKHVGLMLGGTVVVTPSGGRNLVALPPEFPEIAF